MDPNLPSPLAARLEGEPALAGADLGGDDLLVVTPSRSLVYRGEGLLRDEAVEAYPHEMDRLVCRERRRKATLRLESLDGPREFSIGSDRLDATLEAVLTGVLAAAGVTEPGEAVASVFRFSELTLIITGHRVVKHVGAAVWDDDYEQFPFEDVTDLAVEEGTVSTQVVLTVDGRPQRVKAPADEARRLNRALEEALLSYHDVGSLSELRAESAGDDDGDDGRDENGGSTVGEGDGEPAAGTADAVDRMEGIDAIDAGQGAGTRTGTGTDAGESPSGTVGPTTAPDAPDAARDDGASAPRKQDRAQEPEPEPESESDPDPDPDPDSGSDSDSEPDAHAASDWETKPDADRGSDPTERDPVPARSADTGAVLERLDALEAAVERQSERIDEQRATIERLVEELRRGR